VSAPMCPADKGGSAKGAAKPTGNVHEDADDEDPVEP
jgi:hypothetical protein